MFWKKKKQIEPQKILDNLEEVRESRESRETWVSNMPSPLDILKKSDTQTLVMETTPKLEPKVEVSIKNTTNETPFTTVDGELVFSLQDKFNVKKVYFDKNNEGIKTYVFDATEKEVNEYLGR